MVQFISDVSDFGLAERFDRLAAGAEDMTDLMDLIGSVLINGARERISDTNVSPDGVPWPPSLRVQVGAIAAAEDGEEVDIAKGGKTLHQSGALLNSITSAAAPQEVTVGSNLIYAGVHQAGATIKAKTAKGLHFTLANGESVMVGAVTIPARPYLGISDEERASIEDVTAVHFDELLGGGLQ